MHKLSDITRQWGLTISTSKTKTMIIGGREADQIMVLSINGDQVEEVSEFKYLGSVLHQSGSSESDIRKRIARASRAFGMLCKDFQ